MGRNREHWKSPFCTIQQFAYENRIELTIFTLNMHSALLVYHQQHEYKHFLKLLYSDLIQFFSFYAFFREFLFHFGTNVKCLFHVIYVILPWDFSSRTLSTWYPKLSLILLDIGEVDFGSNRLPIALPCDLLDCLWWDHDFHQRIDKRWVLN
jgi:hypothetical protein